MPPDDAVEAHSTIELAQRLNSATRHLARSLRERTPGDLSAEHLSVLNAVVFGGPIAIGDLARREGVTAPAMTKAVGVLEARDLVRRTRDQEDGRVVRVAASTAGKRLILRGRDSRVTRIASALAQLEPTQRGALRSSIEAFERLVLTLESS